MALSGAQVTRLWPYGGPGANYGSFAGKEEQGPPAPAAVTVTPAGSSRTRRRRAYVEIDGQQFEVSSQAEAVELLQRARAIAERQAEQRATVAESNVKRIARRTGSVPPVKVIAPKIVASPDIDVSALIADIARLYNQAAQIAELRVLLEKQLDEEDEELLLL